LKYFILGPTGSGKTTLAGLLGEKLKLPVITASGWTADFSKDLVKPTNPRLRLNYAREMTKRSIEALKADRQRCLNWLKAQIEAASNNCIIEGIRNPLDFVSLFEWGDKVIDFAVEEVEITTPFEEVGLETIRNYLWWAALNNLILPSQHYSILEHDIDFQVVVDSLT